MCFQSIIQKSYYFCTFLITKSVLESSKILVKTFPKDSRIPTLNPTKLSEAYLGPSQTSKGSCKRVKHVGS